LSTGVYFLTQSDPTVQKKIILWAVPYRTHTEFPPSDIGLKCGLNDNESFLFRKHFSNALAVVNANQRMLMKLLSHDEVHGRQLSWWTNEMLSIQQRFRAWTRR